MTMPLSILRLHGRLEDLGCELRGLVRGEPIQNQDDVVLAHRPNTFHTWVVWWWTGQELVYGAYCRTENEAMGEFLSRIQHLRKRQRLKEMLGETA